MYNFKFYSNVTGDVISTTIDLAKIQTKEVDMSAFNNKNEFDYTTPFGKTKKQMHEWSFAKHNGKGLCNRS